MMFQYYSLVPLSQFPLKKGSDDFAAVDGGDDRIDCCLYLGC